VKSGFLGNLRCIKGFPRLIDFLPMNNKRTVAAVRALFFDADATMGEKHGNRNTSGCAWGHSFPSAPTGHGGKTAPH
jgi:hypothetical protein